MRVAAKALAGLCVVAVASFLVVSMLPPPKPGDRIAVRVLVRLESSSGTGGVMQLAGRTLRVTCHRLPPYRYAVSIADGTRLVLSGTHVYAVAGPPAERALAALQRDPGRASAEADLSGSFSLYARQLSGRLARGLPSVTGTATAAGRPAYRVLLGRGRPEVALLVDRRTLRPLVATYRSRALSGSTVLAPSAGPRHWAGC